MVGTGIPTTTTSSNAPNQLPKLLAFLLQSLCKNWPCYNRTTMYCHFVVSINTLRQRQNYRHFADDNFKCIFFDENVWISLQIPLKFVYKVQINNIPALIQIMAWCRPGDSPLSEPMMVSLLTQMCVTRPRWLNSSKLGNASMFERAGSWLVQVMVCLCLAPK